MKASLFFPGSGSACPVLFPMYLPIYYTRFRFAKQGKCSTQLPTILKKSRQRWRLKSVEGERFVSENGHPISIPIKKADDVNGLCVLGNDVKGKIAIDDDQPDSPSGKDWIVNGLVFLWQKRELADFFFSFIKKIISSLRIQKSELNVISGFV
jgi:hypothetical protein